MGMADAKPQFSHLVTSLKTRYPDLAYLSLLEPRLAKGLDELVSTDVTNDFVRDIWAPRPLMSSGGFTLESAEERADQTGDLIAIGRYFISNVSVGFWSVRICAQAFGLAGHCAQAQEKDTTYALQQAYILSCWGYHGDGTHRLSIRRRGSSCMNVLGFSPLRTCNVCRNVTIYGNQERTIQTCFGVRFKTLCT